MIWSRSSGDWRVQRELTGFVRLVRFGKETVAGAAPAFCRIKGCIGIGDHQGGIELIVMGRMNDADTAPDMAGLACILNRQQHPRDDPLGNGLQHGAVLQPGQKQHKFIAPTRATVSPRRTSVARIAATWVSTWSPAA